MSRKLTGLGRTTSILFALLIGALLAACGNSPSYGSATHAESIALDACSLVTQTEAEAALGVPLDAPSHAGLESAGDATTAAASTCRYTAHGAAFISATLFVRRSPAAENTPAVIAATRATIKDLAQREPQDVRGIGDTAFRGVKQLNVFKGERFYLIISVNGVEDDATALAKAEQLAKAALERP